MACSSSRRICQWALRRFRPDACFRDAFLACRDRCRCRRCSPLVVRSFGLPRSSRWVVRRCCWWHRWAFSGLQAFQRLLRFHGYLLASQMVSVVSSWLGFKGSFPVRTSATSWLNCFPESSACCLRRCTVRCFPEGLPDRLLPLICQVPTVCG